MDRLTALWALLTLPATLAHELTHAAVAAPAASRVGITIEPRGFEASALVQWHDEARWWAVIAAGIAPVAAGLIALAAALWVAITSGWSGPATPVGWAKLAIIAAWWGVYVTPSPADLRMVQGGGDGS
jgi:hypothetical protein